jgi:plasmid replication initiation protein
MKETDEQLPSILGNNVTMANVAARAAHSLTLPEKRVVMAGLSFLDSRKARLAYTDAKARTFRITAADYQEIAQLSQPKDAYREIARAAHRLVRRQLKHDRLTPRGMRLVEVNWLEEAVYHEGEGWIEICFTTKVLPYLVEIKSRFTKYKLEQTAGLRSVYSWRLLEYLTSWGREKGARTVDLEKFRQMLEIPESYQWSNIRQKVIEPAIAELAEKDGWEIQWQGVKTGRKFTAITFVWERSAQRDLFREAGN